MVDGLNVSWNILPLSPYWCYIDARQHHSLLFISLLANVQTLENKVDELKARMTFRWYIKVCNFFFFYWHMDGSLSPWLGYCDLSVHLQDWTKESSKQNGGEVYIMTNRRWCVDVHVVLFGVLFWSWIHHDQMQIVLDCCLYSTPHQHHVGARQAEWCYRPGGSTWKQLLSWLVTSTWRRFCQSTTTT